MPQQTVSIEDLIRQLESMDAELRLEALEGIRRYAGNRKADQAVFELRNDSDRRVRTLARDVLAESERRTGESLSVPGSDVKLAEERLGDLLNLLASSDPTDRVTALKDLRVMDHPRALAAVEKCKRDPNRVVRMVAEKASEDRLSKASRPSMRIENGVMVADDPSKPEGRNDVSGVPRAAEMPSAVVPILGVLYLVGGAPGALFCLWLWFGVQGYLPPDLQPDRALIAGIEQGTGRPLDPVLLAFGFFTQAWSALSGGGLMMRKEWGRRSVVTLHSILFFAGLLGPNVFAKIFQGLINIGMVYLFTRPRIIRSCEGEAADRGADSGSQPPGTGYGEMERKTW